ncbi:sulfite exporter TauE/SafE family protein [Lusitaniella coriacea LEGE 07157]|uniref:Probable membrane transporter protein n=1 Tax=Lusitaniella coriacea LEGE 07157 TaxID=945747 RepID=A0A8J7DV51_9CYAN|nr:sulfite exporter TauE/SafE family protein [Lusitaniella coriacea]MBE9115551.1 sulfite exporter TauE/SafE family protein [Lusitaniella coriacea LEGE 07157]
MIIFGLVLASITGWFISSVAGGGSPFILMPVVGFFLGTAAIPPVITTGMIFGNTQRIFIYWREIDWGLVWWYLPGAIAGACLGAFLFTHAHIEGLSIILGLFLVLSAIAHGFGQNARSFSVKAWYFLPAGFFYALLSGLIGSSGPLLNPFYLNYGLVKEELIATKSAHVLVVHAIKIAAYAIFGAFTLPYLLYGLLIGIAALPGNWLGQIALDKISERRFRQLVVTFILFSGIFMVWQQRQVLVIW